MTLQGLEEQLKKPEHQAGSVFNEGIPVSSDPWIREIQLAGAAVASVPEAASEAFTDHLGSTVAKAASAGALTFGLRCASRVPKIGPVVGRVVLPALAIGLATDVLWNGKSVVNAIADNFESDKNWDKNVDVMKNSVGRFAVDLGVSSVGGVLGETAGAHVFGLKAPGVKSLPELNAENIGKHIEESSGTLKSYQLYSEAGGGRRQVDVFIPKGTTTEQGRDFLLGIDSLIINKKPGMAITNGLANPAMDPNIDYIAAFPHAKTFSLLPGVKVSTWFNENAGLLKPGGWFAPVAKYDDVALFSDVRNKMG
ncbi:MAG TPA: hypothetical protein V6C69_08040, partial [Trichormus sp.]